MADPTIPGNSIISLMNLNFFDMEHFDNDQHDGRGIVIFLAICLVIFFGAFVFALVCFIPYVFKILF
jgi:glucan phosphoethanolaminetransferase (alkaline phosphatase superfamily)